MKQCYEPHAFNAKTLWKVDTAKSILAEYGGKPVTLRQLYYRFVGRALVPNTDAEYDKLGVVVSKSRMAGLIAWDAIIDRTRALHREPYWDTPAEILAAAAKSFRTDRWALQRDRLEVWIEKDALLGVIADVCEERGVGYFSCRGYASHSTLHEAAMRLIQFERVQRQRTRILYFGDHDPSGLDMLRDIRNKLALFGSTAAVDPIALTRDQIAAYNLPPNPAKLTDKRAVKYIAEHGPQSWELDALPPDVLTNLVVGSIERYKDTAAWQKSGKVDKAGRADLQLLADHSKAVIAYAGELSN